MYTLLLSALCAADTTPPSPPAEALEEQYSRGARISSLGLKGITVGSITTGIGAGVFLLSALALSQGDVSPLGVAGVSIGMAGVATVGLSVSVTIIGGRITGDALQSAGIPLSTTPRWFMRSGGALLASGLVANQLTDDRRIERPASRAAVAGSLMVAGGAVAEVRDVRRAFDLYQERQGVAWAITPTLTAEGSGATLYVQF